MTNASKFIDLIARWLEASGVTVNLFCQELPCLGMYRSETKTIYINDPSAISALATISHEAGHWLGYMAYGEKKHSYQRERQAFVYGYRVLKLFGADKIISRSAWIKIDKDRKLCNSVDTSNIK